MLMLAFPFYRRSRQEDCYKDAQAHVCRQTKDEQSWEKIALDHLHIGVFYETIKFLSQAE